MGVYRPAQTIHRTTREVDEGGKLISTENHPALGRVVAVKRNEHATPVMAVIVAHYAEGCGPTAEPECVKLKLESPWQYEFGPAIQEIYRRTDEIWARCHSKK